MHNNLSLGQLTGRVCIFIHIYASLRHRHASVEAKVKNIIAKLQYERPDLFGDGMVYMRVRSIVDNGTFSLAAKRIINAAFNMDR